MLLGSAMKAVLEDIVLGRRFVWATEITLDGSQSRTVGRYLLDPKRSVARGQLVAGRSLIWHDYIISQKFSSVDTIVAILWILRYSIKKCFVHSGPVCLTEGLTSNLNGLLLVFVHLKNVHCFLNERGWTKRNMVVPFNKQLSEKSVNATSQIPHDGKGMHILCIYLINPVNSCTILHRQCMPTAVTFCRNTANPIKNASGGAIEWHNQNIYGMTDTPN